jgi:hypothetical protein
LNFKGYIDGRIAFLDNTLRVKSSVQFVEVAFRPLFRCKRVRHFGGSYFGRRGLFAKRVRKSGDAPLLLELGYNQAGEIQWCTCWPCGFEDADCLCKWAVLDAIVGIGCGDDIRGRSNPRESLSGHWT